MGFFDNVSKAVKNVTKKVRDSVSNVTKKAKEIKSNVSKNIENTSKAVKTISNKVRDSYNSVDRSLGGYLPAGVSPVTVRAEKIAKTVKNVSQAVRDISSSITKTSTQLNKDKSVRQSAKTVQTLDTETQRRLRDAGTFNITEIFDQTEKDNLARRKELAGQVSALGFENQSLADLTQFTQENRLLRKQAKVAGVSIPEPILNNGFNFDGAIKLALVAGVVLIGVNLTKRKW